MLHLLFIILHIQQRMITTCKIRTGSFLPMVFDKKLVTLRSLPHASKQQMTYSFWKSPLKSLQWYKLIVAICCMHHAAKEGDIMATCAGETTQQNTSLTNNWMIPQWIPLAYQKWFESAHYTITRTKVLRRGK